MKILSDLKQLIHNRADRHRIEALGWVEQQVADAGTEAARKWAQSQVEPTLAWANLLDSIAGRRGSP